MFKQFLSSLVYEMLSFVGKHPERKQSQMENLRIPAVFKEYLSEVKDDELLEDVKLVITFISESDLKNPALKKSKFFICLVKFLTENLAAKLDKLPSEFYLQSHKKQEEIADKLIAGESLIARALKNLIIVNSYQEISGDINEIAKSVVGSPYIIVQSPREIDTELKSEIRNGLGKEFESGFPIFQINRNLIGGLRVFIDGKSHDFSWFSRISNISTLYSPKVR